MQRLRGTVVPKLFGIAPDIARNCLKASRCPLRNRARLLAVWNEALAVGAPPEQAGADGADIFKQNADSRGLFESTCRECEELLSKPDPQLSRPSIRRDRDQRLLGATTKAEL